MSSSKMNPVGFSSLQAPGSLSILRVMMPSQALVSSGICTINSAAPKFRGGSCCFSSSSCKGDGCYHQRKWGNGEVSCSGEEKNIMCEDHMFPGRKFPCITLL